MEAYFQAFVNFKKNDWARLVPMAKFTYNNAKNLSTGHTLFKVNCGYHPCVSFEENTDPRFQSKSADKLSVKPWDLMIVCQENLYHTQELQKQAHNKSVKPRSYTLSDKVWLNSKYIKTKRKRKLEAKFFGPFQVLYPVDKQAYKLKLLERWRIHDVFHVWLMEQDTTRKKRVDKWVTELETNSSKKYEVEALQDSAVYKSKSELGQLPGLYYLVAWKWYPKEENTWELSSAVQHLKKLINSFDKDYPEKLTATSSPINSALPKASPTVRPNLTPKGKQSRSAGGASKQAKNWVLDVCDI